MPCREFFGRQGLTSGPSRLKLDQRAQQVEAGGHAQRAAHGTHELHAVGEERSVQIADTGFVECATHHVRIVGELGSVGLQDGARTAHGGARAVAVLGHLVARAGDHERRTSGDVEGVLAVAARADDIQCIILREVHVLAGLQQTVAEAEELVHRDAARLERHQQRCDLAVVVGLPGDAEQDVVRLFAGEGLSLDELVQILFHIV